MRANFHLSMSVSKRFAVWCLMWAALACGVAAQSTSVDYPAPISSNEVDGRIAPRDIGDARLTRHFYTFNGREGDLLMTLESNALDGNVDIFTASGLRPLATVTLYAGSSTRITRSVYLRSEQALILRIEARAAGDVDGTYRIRFEGAFAPASGAQTVPPEFSVPVLQESARSNSSVRRVTSTGARIEQPAIERPATAANETTTTGDNAPTERANPSTSATTPATRTTTPARRAARAPRRPTARAARTNPPAASSRADSTDTETTAPEATTPRTGRRGNRRTARNRPAPAATTANESAATDTNASTTATTNASPAPVVTATRLVIETKDGERIERDMSGVRRVSVENSQVVIVGRDGRTQRVPMVNVQRMSIEP